MNIVECILSNAVKKYIKEWSNDDTIYEEGEILVGLHERYKTEPFNPSTYIFKIADGVHTYKELPLLPNMNHLGHQYLTLPTIFKEDIDKYKNKVILISQLICEIQEDGSKKFKLGNGINTYKDLPYIENISDMPIGFFI